MLIRSLDENERDLLAHVVTDPAAWWANACATLADPERALRDKVERWYPDYARARAEQGAAYKTRAQREDE